MKPITFSCHAVLPISGPEIAREILNLEKWPEFRGYAFLPGIRRAEFLKQTPEIVGTRIGVTNADGSNHVEEIVEWNPESRLCLHLQEFSPPVSRIAVRFEETWIFQAGDGSTSVTRAFEMYAKSAFTRPMLAFISIFLKRAIARHLRQMRDEAAAQSRS